MEEYQYLNVSINEGIYSKLQNGNQTRLAVSLQTFPTPFIKEPWKYKMACARMTVPTEEIPLYIATPMMNQPNADVLNLIVGLGYNGVIYTKNVQWIPQYQNAPKPADVSKSLSITGKYLWCQTYEWMLNLINTAFTDAYNELIGVNPGVSGGSPWLEMDMSSNIVSIYANTGAYTGDSPISIYISATLDTLLPNFNSVYISDNITTPFQIVVQSARSGVNTVKVPPTAETADYVKVSQEYPDLGAWCPAQRVVLFLDNPSVVKEQTSPAQPWGTTSKTPVVSTSSNQILTDVQIVNGVGYEGANQANLYYEPTILRWLNINQTDPLTEFNLRLNWADPYDNIYDLPLREGRSVNLKFILQRIKD